MNINTNKSLKGSHQKNWYYYCFLSVITLCFSCKKFVQIPASPDIISRPQVFSDSVNATSAILGMYVNFNPYESPTFATGEITIFTGLLSDEVYPTGATSSDKKFYTNSLDINFSASADLWLNYYKQIYLANDCIEGVSNSDWLNTNVKNQLIGESKVMRAICYFNLINIFGDVPLITTTDYVENKSIGRKDVQSVYDQIIADLIDASGMLSEEYPSAGKARINKYAALALLSRVYLYTSQWQKAEESASAIILSQKYALNANLDDVFLAGSNVSARRSTSFH